MWWLLRVVLCVVLFFLVLRLAGCRSPSSAECPSEKVLSFFNEVKQGWGGSILPKPRLYFWEFGTLCAAAGHTNGWIA